MNVAIATLDHGRIRIFAGITFQNVKNVEVFTIGADSQVERSAAFGGVVENEQDTAIGQRDGVNAGVRVWKIESMNGGPVDAAVVRIGDADFGDLLGGAGVETQSSVLQTDDGGLNDAIGLSGRWETGRDDRTDFGPGVSIVSAAFDPGNPRMITLNRGSTHHGAVGEDERFRANRTVETGREMFDGRPALPVICADAAAA